MSQGIKKIVILMCILGFVGCASEHYTQTGKDQSARIDTTRIMKQQDIIALTKAGVSDSLIIAMMDATNSWFKLTTQDVLNLKNAGVSERVIDAMMIEPNQSSNQNNTSGGRSYYPAYYWYYGFYPFAYYPLFSPGYYHPVYMHHGFGFYSTRRFMRGYH